MRSVITLICEPKGHARRQRQDDSGKAREHVGNIAKMWQATRATRSGVIGCYMRMHTTRLQGACTQCTPSSTCTATCHHTPAPSHPDQYSLEAAPPPAQTPPPFTIHPFPSPAAACTPSPAAPTTPKAHGGATAPAALQGAACGGCHGAECRHVQVPVGTHVVLPLLQHAPAASTTTAAALSSFRPLSLESKCQPVCRQHRSSNGRFVQPAMPC